MAIHTLSIGGSDYEIQPKYASSASYAYYAYKADKADSATTASHALNAGYASSASYAYYAYYADKAGYAIGTGYASSASYADNAGYASSASYAGYASSASYASRAGNANYSNSAGYASSASYADYSTYLTAATSTSKLYLLGQTTGSSGSYLVYKNTNTYISSNAIYASAGFYESSDARLKTITNDVEVDFERLKSIPKIQYIKKGETAPHIGTIAQDLQKVYPEFVETGDDGYMSVDYAKLSIIPLKAVDLLYDEMNKLKDEIKIVKEENQMLKDRLDSIEAIINK